MSRRATLAQADEDLAAARDRIEGAYHEWAAQLAREAASDALALVEDREGLAAPPPGEVGTLAERVRSLADEAALDPSLVEAATVLDEVLEATLEPDHDPGLAWREGGSADYATEADAREAVEAARGIVDACRAELGEPADGDDAS